MKKLLALLIVCFSFSAAVLAHDLRFAQITDVRYSKASSNNALKAAIKDINVQKDINFVVFTGDNIANPDKKNLEEFIKTAKKLNKPFYVVIGDKDVNKHKDLSKKEYQKYLKQHLRTYRNDNLNYTFERSGVIFMVVDGAKDVIPGTNGYYKEDVVNWVDNTLDSIHKKNVIILQHFPLIPPTDNENYITFKAQKYLEVLNKHNNVKAVIAGHFGINKEDTVNGIVHISTAPLPNYRVIDIMDCTTENPSVWAEVKEVSAE